MLDSCCYLFRFRSAGDRHKFGRNGALVNSARFRHYNFNVVRVPRGGGLQRFHFYLIGLIFSPGPLLDWPLFTSRARAKNLHPKSKGEKFSPLQQGRKISTSTARAKTFTSTAKAKNLHFNLKGFFLQPRTSKIFTSTARAS